MENAHAKVVRAFVELNAELLQEWADYEGIDKDDVDFVKRVKSI